FAAAFLVGAMLAFDMGGPINKTAWFFCFSLLEKHIYDWYAIVANTFLLALNSSILPLVGYFSLKPTIQPIWVILISLAGVV
ncbi:hypothetical protein O5161_26735, partial [Escherichia coli]|nr:hypothetical protein [Escherichia coli]